MFIFPSPYSLTCDSVFIVFIASYFSEAGCVYSCFLCLVVWRLLCLLVGSTFPALGVLFLFTLIVVLTGQQLTTVNRGIEPTSLPKFCLAGWSTNGVDLMEISLLAATITWTKYNRMAYLGSDLAQWSANQQVSFSSQDNILMVAVQRIPVQLKSENMFKGSDQLVLSL